MKKVTLKLKHKNLPIYIGNNIFVGSTIANHIKHKDVVIITNTKIANLHLKKVKGSLKGFLVKKDKDSLETKKLHVLLKYKHDKSIIDNIVRQPKNIVFFRAKDLQKLSIGIGVYIISTSKGFMTSDKAFHITRAATIEPPVAGLHFKWVAGPGLVGYRHHIGMPR